MADTIEKGITISFKGDTLEFDKGVSKINGELKGLKSELSLLNRELKLDPTNFDKLSQKMDLLKERESLLKEELEAYKKSMDTMDKNSDEFKKAEQKARNLEIEIGYVAKAIDEMGGNKLSLALNTLGKSFEDVGGKVSSLGQKFSGLSIAAAGVLGSLGKLAYDTISYADDMNTLSKQTGLSTDTLQAFGQMANLIDVDLNTMAKSAQYVAKNIDNKNAIAGYEKLGISVKNANGEYKDAESLLFETLKALQKVENDTERSALANDLLGKSYADLGSIINDATLDIDEMIDSVKENGKVLSKDELNSLNAVNDAIDEMKMVLAGTGKTLIAQFQEPIKKVINTILDLTKKVSAFVDNLSTKQKTAILGVLSVVATIAPALIVIGNTITSVGKIMTTLGSTINTLMPIVKALWTLLTANPLAALVVGITAVITILVSLYNNCEGFRNIVNNVASTIRNAFIGALNSLNSMISNTISWVSNLWHSFTQTSAVQGAINIFNSLKNTLNSVISALQSVFGWLGNVISKVSTLLSSGINKVIGWFSSDGFGNIGAYASGGYGTLELSTTINVNNNGNNLTQYQAQQFGRQIVEYVNDKLGRRI